MRKRNSNLGFVLKQYIVMYVHMKVGNISEMSKQVLTPNQIHQISKVFITNFGFNKIRITGGEPTLRKDFNGILANFQKLEVPNKGITTNGLLLHRYYDQLLAAGFSKINLSLDSLIPEKAAFISKTNLPTINKIQKNLNNILIPAAENNHIKLKINVVTINNFNDDEIVDFVELAERYPDSIEVRFLEYMPFSGNKWELQKVMSEKQLLEKLSNSNKELILQPPRHLSDVAKIYQTSSGARIGFISTITSPFCAGCNRVRITADGYMKNCLFSNNEVDLKPFFCRSRFRLFFVMLSEPLLERFWTQNPPKMEPKTSQNRAQNRPDFDVILQRLKNDFEQTLHHFSSFLPFRAL